MTATIERPEAPEEERPFRGDAAAPAPASEREPDGTDGPQPRADVPLRPLLAAALA
jgi:hypothetical protein